MTATITHHMSKGHRKLHSRAGFVKLSLRLVDVVDVHASHGSVSVRQTAVWHWRSRDTQLRYSLISAFGHRGFLNRGNVPCAHAKACVRGSLSRVFASRSNIFQVTRKPLFPKPLSREPQQLALGGSCTSEALHALTSLRRHM